ncbi:MAG TPA: 3-isopropylmalate dehydrogenase [Methylomirabilota bacterium]|nr:3-isopropylmalate dehydrogenase [Methylomirabilota bacterium]
MRRHAVALLAGDGIGPEVCTVARRCVDAAGERFDFAVAWDEQLVGGAAIDAVGQPLPASTLDACREADAVLLGAVGGPRWDDPSAKMRPEDALLGLRAELELFANLRPIHAHAALASASPLRPEVRSGADLLIVRELTGGLYFGRPQGREENDGVESAVDTLRYTRPEIERIVELAFGLAAERRCHLTSVDKANVLASSRLWREVVAEVAGRHPSVLVEHALVDSMAYLLLMKPSDFDVIVTENLFGDILSDEAAAIAGSLGLLPSASLGVRPTRSGRFGLYEPVHGSAPHIAGRGVANPLGTVASAALMLRFSLGETDAADALDTAVELAVDAGPHTADLGGGARSDEVADFLLTAVGVVGATA